MRCNKFDQELMAALKTFGIDVEDDQEVATVEDVRLNIIWPADKNSMLLTIGLPNGSSFDCYVERARIMAALEEDEQ
jgi:hypothetical protein